MMTWSGLLSLSTPSYQQVKVMGGSLACMLGCTLPMQTAMLQPPPGRSLFLCLLGTYFLSPPIHNNFRVRHYPLSTLHIVPRNPYASAGYIAGTPWCTVSVTVVPGFTNALHNDVHDKHFADSTPLQQLAKQCCAERLQQQEQEGHGAGAAAAASSSSRALKNTRRQQQQQEDAARKHAAYAGVATALGIDDPTHPNNDARHGNGVIVWYERGEGTIEGGDFIMEFPNIRVRESEQSTRMKQGFTLRVKPRHGLLTSFDTTTIKHCTGERWGKVKASEARETIKSNFEKILLWGTRASVLCC